MVVIWQLRIVHYSPRKGKNHHEMGRARGNTWTRSLAGREGEHGDKKILGKARMWEAQQSLAGIVEN